MIGARARGLCLAALATAVVLACGVPSAGAAEPWWNLTSGTRPTSIQPGRAQNEVQEVSVSATGGLVILFGPNETVALFSATASDSEVQTALEEMFGAGNVEVTGGPGGATGEPPYVITFVGELADRPVPVLGVNPETFFFLECEPSATECKGETDVRERAQGRSDGTIVVNATNLGDAGTVGAADPVTIDDALPPGLRAVSIEGQALVGAGTGSVPGLLGSVDCSVHTLSCVADGAIEPYDNIEILISVVDEAARPGAKNEVSVTGGGAPAKAVARAMLLGGPDAGFGAEDYEMAPEEEGGTADTQAGSHMFQLTTTFSLNQTADANPAGLTKDLHFKLPPGLIGNATAYPQCTLKDFLTQVGGDQNRCTPKTAVGVGLITAYLPAGSEVGLQEFKVPVFNLQPAVGEPARFGFYILQSPVLLDTAVRTGEDYGVTVNVTNITQTAGFVRNEVTFWGVPGDPRHDSLRGWNCLLDEHGPVESFPCDPLDDNHPAALLSMPTSCSGEPLQTSVEMDSWADPTDRLTAVSSSPMPTLDGCNRLPFDPSIQVTPDGQAASTPTGLTVAEHVPQEVTLDQSGLSEAQVKDTTVALPAGVALNPAAADGLEACSESQVALAVNAPVTCPESSKVATVEINTPLLPEPIQGAAYLAAQNQNPFGSLVALYIVGEDPKAGIIVKVAGEVKPDPVTGQLVSTFKSTPQLPFEDLRLHFFGGDRAPLSTPAYCGAYTTTASIAPWSGNPPVGSNSSFDVTSGPNGSPCTSPLPFAPTLTAGSTNIQTGAFSPFTMTMSREDGNQNLKAVRLKMPPGLLGTLAGVKLCDEADANAGTCGADSLIGETIVSVGLGGDPYSVRGGRVYITGPYEGAPYGLSIVNPAKAGPYDLGQVIVRAKVEVDPLTAALTVTTDASGPYAIPQIIDGIPLQIKHVNVSIDRPGFTFNPTNCNPMSIGGSLISSEGASSGLSVPFQVTNCATLAFKPGFKVSTSGKVSRRLGASLHVSLTYPKAAWGTQANIRSVKVDLPKQLPSNLKTLQRACPHQVFEANPAACPAESRVGEAKATTPILPVPLAGPAYFVSYGGAKFPELVIVLSGYGTTVQLHGETFINEHTNVTSSTFRSIPDVPVNTFELTLPQKQNYSALAAPTGLCGKALKMPTVFTAQNGLTIKQATQIAVTGCPKAKHKTKKAKGRRAGPGHKRGK